MKILYTIFVFFMLCSSIAGGQQIVTSFAGEGFPSPIPIPTYYFGPYQPIGDGGPATDAYLYEISSIAVDDSGNLYTIDFFSSLARKINTAGIISTIAGYYDSTDGGIGYGYNTDTTLFEPSGVAADHHGNVYIADLGNACIRKIDVAGNFSTFAGMQPVAGYPEDYTEGYSGDGGPANMAKLSVPEDVATDSKGNVYIADANNNRVRKVDTAGIITTIAGTGGTGHTGDGGPAVLAELRPAKLATDKWNNIYVVDAGFAIRKIDTNDIITHIAGNGAYTYATYGGYTSDGGLAFTASILTDGIAVDSIGNIYLADSNRLRKIDTAGIISTLGGATGTHGFAGDGGPVDSAMFSNIGAIAIDRAGHIYLADVGNRRIRKITDTVQYANIANNTGGTICAGTAVTFTAHVPGGGLWHYHWLVDGSPAGGDSATYITTTLGNGDSVVCLLTDTAGTITDTCNTIKMIVAPPTYTSVSVVAATDTLCPGATASYTATGTNGGTAPTYVWQLNSVNQAAGTTYSYIPDEGDTVVCLMTSIATCPTPRVSASTPVIMHVRPAANAGVITGGNTVCAGADLVLADTAAGGVWHSSGAGATVNSGGVVTGVSGGLDVILYTVTNSCDSATAIKIINVYAQPDAGTITGADSVCAGAAITLTDSATGGTWHSSNGTATLLAGAVSCTVTGVSTGADTLVYTATNGCGTDTALHIIQVHPAANAGSISLSGYVCVGATVTLSDTAAGGVWSASNGNATLTGHMLTGMAAGTDTITYAVTNSCGTATVTKVVTVNPQPYAGVITGTTTVCAGTYIVLADTTTGGSWHSSNGNAGITNDTLTGISAGTDTALYVVTNICGADSARMAVTIHPQPAAGYITGSTAVCAGTATTLADTAAGGTWSAINGNATITTAGTITGITTGTDSIYYSVTNWCGTARAGYAITVTPQPYAAQIGAAGTVCAGTTETLTDSISGGVWSSSDNSIATISNTGTVCGIAAGTDTLRYAVTNSCGTATTQATITINAAPPAVHISTHPDGGLCTGTMYQNFGTDMLQSAGVGYVWSAENAAVYAVGTGAQYCLVNFEGAGSATVILYAEQLTTGCVSADSFAVETNSSTIAEDAVVYYATEMVCTDNTADSYQWGYDDAGTLDSVIIAGEVNQDYTIAAPDVAHKHYWVITDHGGCMQKSYYNAPLASTSVQAAGGSVQVWPNPVRSELTISAGEQIRSVVISNVVGQVVASPRPSPKEREVLRVNVAELPAGAYFVKINDSVVRKFVKE